MDPCHIGAGQEPSPVALLQKDSLWSRGLQLAVSRELVAGSTKGG